MKKISFALVLAMIFTAFSVFAVPASADEYGAEFLDFDAVTDTFPSGNLLSNTSFEAEKSVVYWNPREQTLERVVTDKGAYLRMSDITSPSTAFDFVQGTEKTDAKIEAGFYHFTGYFRTAYEGEVTWLRLFFFDENHKTTSECAAVANIYPTSDKWLKVELYVTLDSNLVGICMTGGPYHEFIQSYCIDNFSLEKVNKIPEGYTMPPYFGTPVTAAQAEEANNGSVTNFKPWNPDREAGYEVQGIVVNRDIDFIGTCDSENLTEEMLRDYANSYKGTQVTDFMMNIFCQVAAYPSDVTTDFIDQYNYYMEKDPEAVTNKQKNCYIAYEENDLNYVNVLGDAFRALDIDYWLSYRMNDAHGMSGEEWPENKVTMDFYYKNPDYRRIGNRDTKYMNGANGSYYDNLFDCTHKEVREHFLAIINESLSMFDCDGIELDFQRDMWLWHVGGEYSGLDILTEFMREVNRLVSHYETVRGHEIKIAVRCGSDIETNYDFGFDVITWATEGLMDLVNPTSRWRSIDYDIPVKMWTALMHPYGVEVAPGVEYLINSYSYASYDKTRHNLETLAGAAGNWLSQGADKIYLYNFFISGSSPITDEKRVSTTINSLDIHGGSAGHFNMLTTIGSYDKVMNFNRRVLVTYNDMIANWKMYENQVLGRLPLYITVGSTEAIRIPFGDVQKGSTVEFNFSAVDLDASVPPTVVINGVEADFVETNYVSSGYTTEKMLTYTVPESAYGDGCLVIEITPHKTTDPANDTNIHIIYADVYVKPQN